MSVVLASDPTDDTHTSGGRFSFRGRGLGLGLGLGRRGGTDFSALQAKSDAKDLQVRALLNDFNAQQEMTAAKVKQVEEKVILQGALQEGLRTDLVAQDTKVDKVIRDMLVLVQGKVALGNISYVVAVFAFVWAIVSLGSDGPFALAPKESVIALGVAGIAAYMYFNLDTGTKLPWKEEENLQ